MILCQCRTVIVDETNGIIFWIAGVEIEFTRIGCYLTIRSCSRYLHTQLPPVRVRIICGLVGRSHAPLAFRPYPLISIRLNRSTLCIISVCDLHIIIPTRIYIISPINLLRDLAGSGIDIIMFKHTRPIPGSSIPFIRIRRYFNSILVDIFRTCKTFPVIMGSIPFISRCLYQTISIVIFFLCLSGSTPYSFGFIPRHVQIERFQIFIAVLICVLTSHIIDPTRSGEIGIGIRLNYISPCVIFFGIPFYTCPHVGFGRPRHGDVFLHIFRSGNGGISHFPRGGVRRKPFGPIPSGRDREGVDILRIIGIDRPQAILPSALFPRAGIGLREKIGLVGIGHLRKIEPVRAIPDALGLDADPGPRVLGFCFRFAGPNGIVAIPLPNDLACDERAGVRLGCPSISHPAIIPDIRRVIGQVLAVVCFCIFDVFLPGLGSRHPFIIDMLNFFPRIKGCSIFRRSIPFTIGHPGIFLLQHFVSVGIKIIDVSDTTIPNTVGTGRVVFIQSLSTRCIIVVYILG